jgi:hypothetical protein
MGIFNKSNKLKPIEETPLYRKGEHIVIWGEHVATWARDCYFDDPAVHSLIDFHGKWGETHTDRKVTMKMILAYCGPEY